MSERQAVGAVKTNPSVGSYGENMSHLAAVDIADRLMALIVPPVEFTPNGKLIAIRAPDRTREK
jgi:hypothetical protein